MSDKFEQKLIEWYNKSLAKDLEYLDLSQNQKPLLSELANNLEVTHNQVCFLSKTVLDHFTQLTEENRKLQKEVKQLKIVVGTLEKEVLNSKPLNKKAIVNILQQPRAVEVEAAQATQRLLVEVRGLQKSVAEVKRLIGG